MIRSSLRFVGSKGVGSKETGSKSLTPNRLYAAVLLALTGPVYALPQGGEVVAGEATIDVSGDTMQVLQSSQRAILNFQSFDIDSGQTVNFQQPGSDAVALNRVLGDRLSEIHGALNANGQVYLINPNGVLFGNGAEINVGSLLVTTLDIADQDFLAGRDAFSGNAEGRVENQGSIRAEDRVVLLAPEVVNRGDIQVPDGEILMRSSRQALLHTAGSEIPILVDDPDLVGRVANEGSLQAGEVALVLDGSGSRDLYDAAIDNSGMVRAVRASGEGGEIHLLADTGIINSGTLDASATQGAGGNVSLEADSINQSGTIRATAVGDGDGGQIELLADNAIAMHSGSTIDASADQTGDAGDVVVIAEKSTWFTGDAEIKARGGANGGDGGFVEVSGREFIQVVGEVDVGADHGDGGLWFIDPTDISIVEDGLGADFGGTFNGSNPADWVPENPVPASASINIVTLRNTLNNDGDVRISTASSGAGQGNITFNASLDYNGVGGLNTLTLEADGSIIFNPGIFISDSDPGTVEGLNFNATAGTGFVLPNTSSIFAHTGKINITVLAGDATFTGLGSAANAADAIRVTANAGRLINGGAATWNLTVPSTDAGVILSARDGIGNGTNNITIGNIQSANGTLVNAVSSGGDIYVRGEGMLRINNLSSANYVSAHAGGELWLTDSSTLDGDNFRFSSSTFIALPQNGLTAPGALTLQGPDIVTHNAGVPGGRTLTLGATDLVINTTAAGGNLQINSTASSLDLTNSFSNTVTVTETDGLVLSNLNTAGSVFVTTGGAGDLQIGNVRLGGNGLTLDFDAGGALTYTGALTSAAGANNITFNFNSAAALNLNGSLRDSNSANNSTHNYTFTAGTDFVMAADAVVGAGDGQIAINANNGSATVTGLSTLTTAQNAVRITALNGSILDANPGLKDIDVPNGGFLLHAEGDIGELFVESNFMDAVSATGDIAIREEMSTSVLRLETPGTATITTGGQFSVDLATTFQVENLVVDAGGDFRVADEGFSVPGDLTVIAETIRGFAGTVGSGTLSTPVILSAANANISLRNGELDRVWETTFDQLALNIAAGDGAFTLEDTDGLTLTGITLGGDASFTSNNADLVLTASPDVSGSLSLRTLGTGDLVIPETGLDHGAVLTVDVENIVDSNSDVILAATNANITLRDGAVAQSWNTRFDQLALEIIGGGDFSLVDEDGLTLNAVATAGNVSFTATGADLLVTSAPLIGGNLTLETDTSGDVVIPDAGLSYTGDLTVVADNLLDSNAAINLSAANADITLRDGTPARSWTTNFEQLTLSIGSGTGSFALVDSDGLILNAITTGGNASFTTTNADLVLTDSPAVAGNLSLITNSGGDVVIPDSGLQHSGNLTLTADNLRDSDSSIIIGATNGDIVLRDGTVAQSWTSSFSQLTLDIAGDGDFSLVDSDGLTLNTVETGGNASFTATDGDLVLTSAPVVGGSLTLATANSGDVVIPDAGLSYTGNLTVVADNLVDSDEVLDLTAAAADITLRDGSGNQVWNTNFDELVVSIAGAGDLTLTDADGLTLNAVSSGGDVRVRTTEADLSVAAGSITANSLDLATVTSGDVVIDDGGLSVSGSLTVDADNLRDSDNTIALVATSADILLRDGTVTRSWTTTFDELTLDLASTGDFALANTAALTLNAVNTGGNASFSTTAADLVLSSSPVVAGDLVLATENSGDVIVADAGLTHSGDLTITADNLVSSGATVTLAATNADITLRGGDLPQSWVTTFDSLVLDIAGAGDFLLTDIDGLTLDSITTGGNATFRTTNADLVVATAPAVAGDLELTTVGSGDLVIPETGLAHSNALTIDADNLLSGGASVILAAIDAGITLRGGDLAQSWDTSFDSLILDIAGTGDFLLTDTDGLTLDSITTAGNATFRTTNADLIVASTLSVVGDLELGTVGSGDVVIPETGLVHSGALTIDTDNLLSSGSTVTLAATDADITLRGGDLSQSWVTTFDSLVLDIAGAGDFLLTDTDGLTLDSVTTGGNATFRTTDADLVVTAALAVSGELGLGTVGAGDVVIPDAGLSHSGDLTIDTNNLRDTDTALTLAAANAAITLRDGAAAQTWNSTFDSLALAIDGAGALNLTDTDGLTLTSVTTGGAASFATTAADLVLQSSPDVGGTLNLVTNGSGDVVIPDAGLNHSADLIITADNLVGGATPLILAATTADITLRDGATVHNWTTSFDTLVLDIAGAGDVTLTDTDGLTLSSVTAGGNASFTATGADLVLTASPQVAGDLTLATDGGGDLVIPNAGLAHNGTLTLTADSVRDSDSTVSITATDLVATLANQQTATTWNTSVDRLVMSLAGGGALSLASTDSLLLDSLTSDGLVNLSAAGDLEVGSLTGAADMALTSSGDMTLLNSSYDVNGQLSLTTANNLQLAAGGLTVTDAMQLQAESLTPADGEPLVLGGFSADLTLTGDQALALSTRLSQLGLTYNTTSSLTLDNDRSLTLTRFDIPNVTTLGLTVNGTLTMPDTGLAASERINIDAVDLLDSDRDLAFAAPELAVRLSGTSGNHNWDVTADSLDVLLRGQANLHIAAAEGLVLEDLNNDARAIAVENGNFSVALASGDLILAGNIQASDLSDDDVRAGVIDLAVAGGSLLTRGPVEIVSSNLVDQEVGDAGDAYGIRLRLTDTTTANRSIILGDDIDAAIMRAVGGDILLDTRAPGTAAAAERNLVRNAGSTIDIFDNPGDAITGQVLRNGSPIAAETWQTVRAGRTLAIITDVAVTVPDNVLDDVDDLDGSTEIVKDVDKSGPKAAAQFEQVFGTCDELDKKNQHRCRVDDALKAFLSHWLVGGEMPPRTEIR